MAAPKIAANTEKTKIGSKLGAINVLPSTTSWYVRTRRGEGTYSEREDEDFQIEYSLIRFNRISPLCKLQQSFVALVSAQWIH